MFGTVFSLVPQLIRVGVALAGVLPVAAAWFAARSGDRLPRG